MTERAARISLPVWGEAPERGRISASNSTSDRGENSNPLTADFRERDAGMKGRHPSSLLRINMDNIRLVTIFHGMQNDSF